MQKNDKINLQRKKKKEKAEVEMQKDFKTVRCTELNGTERKCLKRHKGTFDTFFGIGHRIRTEEMEVCWKMLASEEEKITVRIGAMEAHRSRRNAQHVGNIARAYKGRGERSEWRMVQVVVRHLRIDRSACITATSPS